MHYILACQRRPTTIPSFLIGTKAENTSRNGLDQWRQPREQILEYSLKSWNVRTLYKPRAINTPLEQVAQYD